METHDDYFTGASQTSSYRVDFTKSPKQLDLVPIAGSDKTATKYIYSLEGDELKIAFSSWIVFGSEWENQLDRIKMKQTRPTDFDAGLGSQKVVWVLKRVKK